MIHRHRRFILAACSAAAFTATPVSPARAALNPGLKWNTISTEHFDVHFHDGAEWTAQRVADVAEEVYPAITGLYQYEPDRCHFVILDTEDYANGAAYFYDNKIEIWATNLEFGFRGTTQWLRNVVTHEFAHVVSIQAAMKLPRRIPAVYLQWIRFEKEKRPDVITGYPDAIASYPFVGAIVPPWWAEGVAQFQSPHLAYDCWDTHRDMILRSAVIKEKMLSYEEMGSLDHRSIDNERVYDHGYGLVRYIASTYGPETVRQISDGLGSWYRLTIDGAIARATGKSGKEIYTDWKKHLQNRYERQLAQLSADPREGRVLADGGFMTLAPAYSRDGARMAYLSNKGSDYSGTAVYLSDSDGKNAKRLKASSSPPAFSPDGNLLLYARHEKADRYGSKLSDLFVYDIEARKERRLTHAARVAEPSFSPDGKNIVCVQNGDGTHRLAVVDAAGGLPRVIFENGSGTQMYAPRYSPDGSRILFGVFTSGTRDIASVDANGGDFVYHVRTGNDERDAAWRDDGTGIVFASDRTGIFNVYDLDIATGEVRQLTNVTGGAFTPAVSRTSGAVAYSAYDADGYHVAVLDAGGAPVATMPLLTYGSRAAAPFDECETLKSAALDPDAGAFAASSLAAVGASSAPAGSAPYEAHKYKRAYTDFQLFPRVVLWDGVPRFGAFIASNELLDKESFFLSGSYGTDGGFDAQLALEIRRMYPVLFMDFYSYRQKYDETVQIDDLTYFLDIRYDLWSADLGTRLEFADRYSLTHRHDLSLWYSHGEYKVHLDPQYRDTDGVIRPDTPVGWKYFNGNEFNLQWRMKSIPRALDSDINPRGGREVSIRAMYAIDELFTSGEFEYGFNPKFDTNKFGQYTLDYREYIPIPVDRHTLQIRLMGSYIDNVVDDFFWVYLGGMDGLRGYTYYTLGGRAGALASATWRFPILRGINRQLSWITLKDLYGGAFYEMGNAWSEEGFKTSGYKHAAGYELRLNAGSFYSYPMTMSFTGARALDTAVYSNPLFPDNSVIHDPQWRYYFQLGFTF